MSNISQVEIPLNSCTKAFEPLVINLPVHPKVILASYEVEWYNRPFNCNYCHAPVFLTCCCAIHPACVKCYFQGKIQNSAVGTSGCKGVKSATYSCPNQITEANAKINNSCYTTMPTLKE